MDVLVGSTPESGPVNRRFKANREADVLQTQPRTVGTPLAFDDEQRRQIRQDVHQVFVIGSFGVDSLTSRELLKRGTGWSTDVEEL